MVFRSYIITICCLLFSQTVFAQESDFRTRLSRDITNELIYTSSWSANFRLRSDGWQVGGEITKSKNYFRSTIYQFDLGLYKHPKQVRQNKDPYAGFFNSNGIRPFIYGKQHSLFALHAAIGQKFLLAEKARRNGVMINYYYVGGVTLGLLKPYYLRVCADAQCSRLEVVTYDPDSDNNFLNYDYIYGGAGFGKGWELKFRPGLHARTGLQFDWSSQDNVIKAVEVGISADGYFGRVPMMVIEKNKFLFFNAFVGISMGKKK